jgi:hypothetical protein
MLNQATMFAFDQIECHASVFLIWRDYMTYRQFEQFASFRTRLILFFQVYSSYDLPLPVLKATT